MNFFKVLYYIIIKYAEFILLSDNKIDINNTWHIICNRKFSNLKYLTKFRNNLHTIKNEYIDYNLKDKNLSNKKNLHREGFYRNPEPCKNILKENITMNFSGNQQNTNSITKDENIRKNKIYFTHLTTFYIMEFVFRLNLNKKILFKPYFIEKIDIYKKLSEFEEYIIKNSVNQLEILSKRFDNFNIVNKIKKKYSQKLLKATSSRKIIIKYCKKKLLNIQKILQSIKQFTIEDKIMQEYINIEIWKDRILDSYFSDFLFYTKKQCNLLKKYKQQQRDYFQLKKEYIDGKNEISLYNLNLMFLKASKNCLLILKKYEADNVRFGKKQRKLLEIYRNETLIGMEELRIF